MRYNPSLARVETTIRFDELTLAKNLARKAEGLDQPAVEGIPPKRLKRGVAGITRGALRFALEHEEQFLKWVSEQREGQGL